MNKKLLYSLLFLGFALVFNSCKDDEPLPEPQPQPVTGIQPGQGVFITNEGGFQAGNATVGYWKYSDTSITGDLFQPANQQPLGDICQSMTIVGNKGYVVVNNSGKVEVVNLNDFKRVATITGLTSPRYFLPVNSSKAYVTDLFGGSVSIVNLATNSVSGTISIPGWTEAMILIDDEVFVCNTDHDKLYVIDSQTDLLTDSITVTRGAVNLALDANEKLWVLCAGDVPSAIAGGLYRINPSTHQVEQSFTLTASYSIKGLSMNPNRDTLYYINTDAWRMAISATQLPTASFLSGAANAWYALGIAPNGEIYIGDAIDYVQPSVVYRYSPSGILQSNKRSGILSGSFTFY